jgi:hypothetical protein
MARSRRRGGRRSWVQAELPLPRRGGRRRGAGRKPRGARAGVAHRPRPSIRRNTPVHVTVRLVPEVGNVRRFKLAPAMRRAFAGGAVTERPKAARALHPTREQWLGMTE